MFSSENEHRSCEVDCRVRVDLSWSFSFGFNFLPVFLEEIPSPKIALLCQVTHSSEDVHELRVNDGRMPVSATWMVSLAVSCGHELPLFAVQIESPEFIGRPLEVLISSEDVKSRVKENCR